MPAPVNRAEELAAALDDVLTAAEGYTPDLEGSRTEEALRLIRAALADGYSLRPDPYTPPADPIVARLVGRRPSPGTLFAV